MKKSDIRELYSIDMKDGVTILIKRDIDKYVESCDEYSYTPNLLVNPKIMILDNGTLTFSGTRLSYTSVRDVRRINWLPIAIRDLKKGVCDRIFYDEDDIILKDIVTWERFFIWPFKKKVVEKVVKHFKLGITYVRLVMLIHKQHLIIELKGLNK